MENIESENFRQFHEYVFGDYRYFLYNGLSEDLLNSLSGPERATAERLVLKAVTKGRPDERAIRAAGYLRLEAAVPILEKKLKSRSIFTRKEIRSAIAWALLKIQPDKGSLDGLIYVIYGGSEINDLTRLDAIELLSDYGDEVKAVKTLLTSYFSDDLMVRMYSYGALREMFRKDPFIRNLLSSRNDATILDRNSTVAYIKSYLHIYS